MYRTRICLLLLFVSLQLQAVAPGGRFEGLSYTRTDVPGTGLANPAQFAFHRTTMFDLALDFGDNVVGRNVRLLSLWQGLALGVEAFARGEDDFVRYHLGHGTRVGNFMFGSLLSWYSADDGPARGLVSAGFGITRFLSSHFSLALTVRDIVLSDRGNGVLHPEYGLGFGINLLQGALQLHGAVSLEANRALDTSTRELNLQVAPTSLIQIGGSWINTAQGNRFGLELHLRLGRLGLAGFAAVQEGSRTFGSVSLSYRARPVQGLASLRRSCLVVNLGQSLPELPTQSVSLFGRSTRSHTFLELLLALQRAASDSAIKAIYLKIPWYGLGFGRSEELLAVLRLCRKRGKQITAYLESNNSRAYALASVAHKIYLHPSRALALRGVGTVFSFVKGFFDKLGLSAQVTRFGKYKNAPLRYINSEPTPEQLEATGRMLQHYYDFLVESIARNRLSGDTNKAAAWLARGIVTPDQALKEKIIDGIQYQAEVKKTLKKAGLTLRDAFHYLAEQRGRPRWGNRPLVAVVHVSGAIITGKSRRVNLPFFGGLFAGSDTLVPLIHSLAGNSRVKAIVIRVQSGGGSVLASDKIWRAVKQARTKKPLLVSFGDIAASGGYYLACGGKKHAIKIHAPRTCLTGSIGVYSVKINARGLRRKLGLSERFLEKGKFALMDSFLRPYSEQEEKLVGNLIRYYYDEFVAKVAAARRKTIQETDAIAQGRVWSGRDALEKGLIDGHAGLLEVIDKAAEAAGLSRSHYRIMETPTLPGGLLGLLGIQGAAELLELLADPGLKHLLQPGSLWAMLPVGIEVH